MSRYFAYTRFSRPTGRILADLLGFPRYGVRTPSDEPLDTLLRWGSRRKMPPARQTLNPAAAIALASDKFLAIERWQEAGLPTVQAFRYWGDAQAAARGGVVFGRTRSGMQGQGITVYGNVDGLPTRPSSPHEWYSLYEQPTREIRLHVVGGEVVHVQGKYLDFPEMADGNPYIRNHGNGYRYRTPRQKVRTRRQEIAIEACRILGLNFGAVDMLLFGSEKKARLLEVNTAPSCSPLTLQKYASALSEILRSER
jgi:glutathione synthase/RimK-type ligase-like ATP-grasp enzyme